MKPKILHQEAMEYSFKAKQNLEEGNFSAAYDTYKKAAELESQVAEFYFDKPELEPTRSVIIRSAAFLNLKAGLIEEAQRFIFFGLLNLKDEQIKNQLNDALELAVSLRNSNPDIISNEFNYINLLRQRSIHYVLEPISVAFCHSVSLEMIKDFSESYLKSLKAYARTKYKRMLQITGDLEDSIAAEIEKLVNPLVTHSGYGSFKFSITNDFLTRPGEAKQLVELKANIVQTYHHDIFTNPLSDSDIEIIKKYYTNDEVNEIFRPLIKIKSTNTPYKIGYTNPENLSKSYVNRIVNKQRQKLITIRQLSQEDIGELENSIIHKRSSKDGRISKKTIFKELLKSLEFDIRTNQIFPKDYSSLILNEEILVNVFFNSESGFRFVFDDFNVEYIDTEYERGLTGFYSVFYEKTIFLANQIEKKGDELKDWEVITKLIGNIESLKK